MLLFIFLVAATAFLAYSNGANDNFKGVATLFGSNTTNYKTAINWATITTFLGSVASIFLAAELVKRFSGKGLVPEAVAGSPEFLLAVALGAGATVLLATLIGFPISTTHSLTGALVGGGMMAVGNEVNFSVLGSKFFLPLLASPFLAALLAGILYIAFHFFRKKSGVNSESSLTLNIRNAGQNDALSSGKLMRNVGQKFPENLNPGGTIAYSGTILGINAQKLLDSAHYLSAGIVSFARGLNDTPKIVALLIAVEGLGLKYGMVAVGVAMAIGGLLNARKVAETMSKKITPLNPGQGFTANIVTGFLVIFASRWGMPVSTTHVSVGSLFGIGTSTGKINKKMSGEILLSWVLTLPVAASLSALVFIAVS